MAEFPDKSQLDIDVPVGDATPEGIRAFIVSKRNPPPIPVKGAIISLAPPAPPPDPLPPPPPSPLDVWIERARRLARLKALGLANPDALQDLADLQEIVDLTYRKGFADGF